MKSIQSDSNVSSMRISLYWVVAMAGVLVMAISTAVVVQASNGGDVDWNGVGLAIGAIGVFIAPAFGFKAYQKKQE